MGKQAKEMQVKKAKRKCMVRGCRNTESFALSRTRESGNSIIICEECARKSIDAIKKYKETQTEAREKISNPPALFPSGEQAKTPGKPQVSARKNEGR